MSSCGKRLAITLRRDKVATGITFPYLSLKTRMQAHKDHFDYKAGILDVLQDEGACLASFEYIS